MITESPGNGKLEKIVAKLRIVILI